ncbi:hypothetical protein LR48_Vigan05g084100 [Vigna angularis]|uniref:Uncharacterized protein n=1 Tax=Phaseolus angularis TaxID=3914 RepID=A0A0L9UKY7_PHAAN|nr:hypothetical protein LR48_Vigan05g084100 [Vigna angularis]
MKNQSAMDNESGKGSRQGQPDERGLEIGTTKAPTEKDQNATATLQLSCDSSTKKSNLVIGRIEGQARGSILGFKVNLVKEVKKERDGIRKVNQKPETRKVNQKPEKSMRMEETLSNFIQKTESTQKSTEAAIKNLETQMGQITKQVEERPSRSCGANTEVNPREECEVLGWPPHRAKRIKTIRSKKRKIQRTTQIDEELR